MYLTNASCTCTRTKKAGTFTCTKNEIDLEIMIINLKKIIKIDLEIIKIDSKKIQIRINLKIDSGIIKIDSKKIIKINLLDFFLHIRDV